MKKSFVILILIVLLAGCQKNQLSEDGKAQLTIKTIGVTTVENFESVGYTVVEMLQRNHKIKISFGNSIGCIDDVCATSGYWWPLYVNDKKSSIGPQSYIVKNNDKIEFVLSEK